MKDYGKEVILDLHNCDVTKFTRASIKSYFVDLCELIKMERGPLHWWDFKGNKKAYDAAPPHLKGISAVQFISTSDIVIHTLNDMKKVYINIFSCKDFDPKVVEKFTKKWFKGKVVNKRTVKRI